MPFGQPDAMMLAGLAAGDPDAQRLFEQRFRGRFELIAGYSGVPPQDCEDIAQEALIAAFSQIARGLFRNESSLGTWLEVIVRGKIADYKRRTRPVVSIDGEAEHDLSSLTTSLRCAPAYEVQILVREILAQMSPQRRMVLILNRIVGLTTDEISHRTGWPAGTISRLLVEAKQEFRHFFADSEDFDGLPRQRIMGSNE